MGAINRGLGQSSFEMHISLTFYRDLSWPHSVQPHFSGTQNSFLLLEFSQAGFFGKESLPNHHLPSPSSSEVSVSVLVPDSDAPIAFNQGPEYCPFCPVHLPVLSPSQQTLSPAPGTKNVKEWDHLKTSAFREVEEINN